MQSLPVLLIAATITGAFTPALRGQTTADSVAIRVTAMDYIEGWYTGNTDRMTQALHPELAKRMVHTDRTTGRSELDQQSAMTLILNTKLAGGQTPPGERREDYRLLDVYHGAAVVKIVAAGWVDYLQLARWNGHWKIVNVLWELSPAGERTQP